MRIAQVTNLFESVPPIHQHGLEQVVYDLTEELVQMGHDVTVFGTADSKTSAKIVPVWPIAVGRDEYGSLLNGTAYTNRSVAEVFNRYRDFDIIHDHTRFVAPLFAKLISTPIVSTVHHPIYFERKFLDDYPPEYHPYFEHSYEQFKNVHTVVVSQFQANKFPFESTVIPNGIPLSKWVLLKEKPGNYLAFLGYITPDKGVAEAIQAVLPTKEMLKIAGPLDQSAANQKYFNEQVKPYLNDRIEYVGPLNFDEKKGFLTGAKALLNPIQWDEPFGLVVIESLVCGTPVIAINRAAMPEIIEDGVSGFLANSVEEMTEKIGHIGEIRRENCRRRVEEHFSAKKMAQEYVKLYEQILNR